MWNTYATTNYVCYFSKPTTAWKVYKYGVFSGLYFPVFGLNTEIYEANLHTQSTLRQNTNQENSVFGHFSHSEQPHLYLASNTLNIHLEPVPSLTRGNLMKFTAIKVGISKHSSSFCK